jgi:hypothetical protein
MVTSGASGAIALAGGACVAGTDPEVMQAIPDLSSVARREFIVDGNLPTGYDPAARCVCQALSHSLSLSLSLSSSQKRILSPSQHAS